MQVGRKTLVLATTVLALVAGVALAQEAGTRMHRMHGNGMSGGGMFPFFSKALNLTDEQHAQIKQIFQNAKPTLQPLWKQERDSHKAMMQLITSGNFDPAKAQAIAGQESQIHAQLEVQHAQLASQAYQVLTPEQKTKLSEMMAEHEQHMKERMEKREQAPAPDQAPNQ